MRRKRAPRSASRAPSTRVAQPRGDPEIEVIIHQAWRGIEVRRLPELARAAVAGDPLVDAEARGFALAFVAGALNVIDEVGLAEELLGAALERAMALGDPLTEVCLRCCRAWARIYGGRLAAAAEDLDCRARDRRRSGSARRVRVRRRRAGGRARAGQPRRPAVALGRRAGRVAARRRRAGRPCAGRAAGGRRQIAGALFLSPKTVEGHLTSVFRKLGVSSRTELAPLLARRP
jgi:hypothetical protein